MPNPGCTIDTANQRVLDRDGQWHAVDTMTVAGRTLYYARPVPADLFDYQERWVLAEEGWVLNRFRFRATVPPMFDWYDETELIAVDGSLWQIRDGYIDVEVRDGRRYDVHDADELGDALRAGEITTAETALVLASLERLCDALRECGYSGVALLAKYAPDLPR